MGDLNRQAIAAKELKICLIGPYPPQEGGIATHVKELQQNLLQRGHSVQVITWGWGRREESVFEVPTVQLPIVRGICFVILAVLATCVLVHKHRANIIHAHYFFPYGFVGAVCGKLSRKPVIITAHGSDLLVLPRNPFYKFIIRNTAKACSCIIVVAEYLRKSANNLGIRAMMKVIPSGIEKKRFSSSITKEESRSMLGLPIKSKIILFVGRLAKPKRPDLAIFALKDIIGAYPETYLILVGSGPLRTYLEKLSAKIGIGDNVIFQGVVPYQDMPELYRASDIFVLPSDSEGTPIAILEAMASKRPVIASAVGGIPEIIRNGSNGILIDPDEKRTLTASLRHMLRSDSVRNAIAQKGYRTVEDYDWSVVIKEIEATYLSTMLNSQ